MRKQDMLIVVRGGGDIATGTIHRLWKSGFQLLVLEAEYPSAIRRQVSVCEAVYQGETKVEELIAVLIEPKEMQREALMREIKRCYSENQVPVLVDPGGKSIGLLSPLVVIDAILAKKNMGTTMDMAPLTIALGPGFEAGVDVHYVIETMRGHNLARIIPKGFALPNTGIPGAIAGYDKERVIHASDDGRMELICQIGDYVKQGESIANIRKADDKIVAVKASITGFVRGLITDGYPVVKGFKIADIDPREKERENCFTISDKARCIAGSVLELVCGLL